MQPAVERADECTVPASGGQLTEVPFDHTDHVVVEISLFGAEVLGSYWRQTHHPSQYRADGSVHDLSATTGRPLFAPQVKTSAPGHT